jgi:hypothetical protein
MQNAPDITTIQTVKPRVEKARREGDNWLAFVKLNLLEQVIDVT